MTSVRNEAPFLIEWIAHNQAIGVTDFLVFSNDCDDGTAQMLDALDGVGILTHLPQQLDEGISPQWQALRTAWKHPLRKACDWAMVCDVDEFVNVHLGKGSLTELIDAVPGDADGILLPWRLFGNNGQVFFEDRPTTELFTASMPENCDYPVAATFFKSLFRTDGPFNQFGIHRPKQKTPEKSRLPIWVNGGGQRMPEFFALNPQRLSLYQLPNARNLAECNHYSLRSAESFLVKRARGLPNRTGKEIDLAYWVERNFNTVENRSIAKIRAATQAREEALLAIADLRELRDKGVQWHRQKFLELMLSEPDHRVFSQIVVSGSSQSPNPSVSRKIVKWYNAALERGAPSD